jgi:CheY-like chemotaxis protein
MSERRKRVLLVDDNVDSVEMVAELLRLRGFDVAVANDPHAALELASTFLPEVAVLDIGLPDLDGYELARRIAQSGIECRLIAVTGYGHDSDRERAREAGFAVHLLKPTPIAAILAAITPGDQAQALAAERLRDGRGNQLEEIDARSAAAALSLLPPPHVS